MSTFKKLLALTLALAMVLSVSAFAGSYKADTYKDAAGIDEDCEEAIELLYALDIMKGDANGNFNPTATITRAEVAKMIYVILNYGKDDKAVNYTGAKMFSDVPAGAWFEGYVNYAAAIKLVQGRGNGTFGPNDPITCAEAAKMLLTAIGYSAADRGYTGANWDKNVLSDAAIIGLLEGYNYLTTTYAPRQWVAVMFQNALLNAYTYNKMAPVITGGLLTSQTIPGYSQKDYLTFGQKYFPGLDVVEGVMTATDSATLTGTFAASGTVTIKGQNIKNTGLGYMDLGECYRVVVLGSKALSTRNTGEGEVGIAALKDITAVVEYSTSGNLANNSYVFTIGDLEANFADFVAENNKVTRDAVAAVSTSDVDGYVYFAKNLYAEMGTKTNDLVKAVAYDGEIEYIVKIDYSYGYVDYVGNSSKYGEYVQIKNVNGNYVTAAKSINLYLSDVIETEDELVKGNYVRMYVNPDSDLLNVEVLPVIDGASYDKKTTKGIYVFDGESYYLAAEGWVTDTTMKNYDIDDEVVLVYDDGLVVYLEPVDTTYKTLEAVNEQLAIIYDYYYIDDIHFSNGTSEKIYNVYYMTIDGEKHVAQYALDYDIDSSDYVKGETLTSWIDADWRLFILHTEDDETVWAEELDADTVNDQLNVDESVIDDYSKYHRAFSNLAEINTKYNTMYVNGVRVAEIDDEVQLFVRLGTSSYAVKTLAELRDSVSENSIAQVLTLTNSRNVPVVQAGYLDLRNLSADEYAGYIYLMAEDNGYTELGSDKYAVAEAVLSNGDTEEDIVVKLVGEEPSEAELYSYTYNVKDGYYELTKVVPNKSSLKGKWQITEKWNEDDAFEEYKVSTGEYFVRAIGDQVIALSTYTIELDEAVADKREALDMIEEEQLERVFEETKFVDFDDLGDEIIEGKEDEGPTYYYAVEYRFDNNIFYVKLIKIQIEAGNSGIAID